MKNSQVLSCLFLSIALFAACTPQQIETNVVESDPIVSDLGLRLKEAADITMKMGKDGFDEIQTLFPDLAKIYDATDNEDLRNMMKKGAESWYYTPEGNFTVAVCNEANSPIHIFPGKMPTQSEIDQAVTEIKEMMESQQPEVDLSQESPQYINYSPSTYQELLGKKPFVLFFHANWCPTCLYLEENIKNELSTFPNGTKILQADFDTETELKNEYKVYVQSTLVVINSKGEAVKTLAAPENPELIEYIKKSL